MTVSVKDKQQKAVLKVSLCICRHISQEHLATVVSSTESGLAGSLWVVQVTFIPLVVAVA